MAPEVWEAVTGVLHPSAPATISGYIRRTVAGACFPGILATGDLGDRVTGLIYREIDVASLELLDEFESDFYVRGGVDAVDAAGQITPCEAYIVPPENAHLLAESPWDFEQFAADELDRYLERNFFS